jgi:hypothetical protein
MFNELKKRSVYIVPSAASTNFRTAALEYKYHQQIKNCKEYVHNKFSQIGASTRSQFSLLLQLNKTFKKLQLFSQG